MRNTTVLGIGANIGLWTELMSENVGKSGKVLAFEPINETFKQLTRRTSNLFNVERYNCALSDIVGEEIMLNY